MIDDISYDENALELISGELCVSDALLSDWNNSQKVATVTFTNSAEINGIVLKLVFKVKFDAEIGDYSITYGASVTTKNEGEPERQVDIVIEPATITVVEYIIGDMNGDFIVDSDDAIHLLRHTLMPDKYSINQDGDVNGDDIVDSDDAIHLLRHVLMPDKYPIG